MSINLVHFLPSLYKEPWKSFRMSIFFSNFSEKNIDIRNDRLSSNYDVIVSLHNFYKLKLKDYNSMQNSKDWFEKFKFQKIF